MLGNFSMEMPNSLGKFAWGCQIFYSVGKFAWGCQILYSVRNFAWGCYILCWVGDTKLRWSILSSLPEPFFGVSCFRLLASRLASQQNSVCGNSYTQCVHYVMHFSTITKFMHKHLCDYCLALFVWLLSSLVPRPSCCPAFARLHYTKNGRGRAGPFLSRQCHQCLPR